MAIVGVLSVIALPAYQDYQIRAKVTEGIMAASACKNRLTEIAATGDPKWPVGNRNPISVGCGEGVASRQYYGVFTLRRDGLILLSFNITGEGINSKEVYMAPYIIQNGVERRMNAQDFKEGGKTIHAWRCGPPGGSKRHLAMQEKYLPPQCRGQTINFQW